MKTYSEMFQDSIDMTDGSTSITEKDYKAIQLDAYRAGMLMAEKLVFIDGNPELAKERIITTANNLKPEDVN